MLLISGKMALTQQSTGIGDWFLAVEDGERPMWQPTTSDLVVFFISQNQLLRIEMAVCGVMEQTTIYKKNTYHGYDIWEGFKVLIAIIWQRMDSTIHMYVEKMRYPEIHQNNLNQANYTFSVPYSTNPIQCNNQLTYRSKILWLFRVENHFIKCYVVICSFCTYKIRWTKLRCWSWYITCMIVWLLYTIRIYSNNTKQEINMIINSSIYVIVILFNCSHHVHVILKNPSRYKACSKDHNIEHHRRHRRRHRSIIMYYGCALTKGGVYRR